MYQWNSWVYQVIYDIRIGTLSKNRHRASTYQWKLLLFAAFISKSWSALRSTYVNKTYKNSTLLWYAGKKWSLEIAAVFGRVEMVDRPPGCYKVLKITLQLVYDPWRKFQCVTNGFRKRSYAAVDLALQESQKMFNHLVKWKKLVVLRLRVYNVKILTRKAALMWRQ